ncbi:MAG TPA: hypothetical protein VFI11_03595 [Anaerolineales bacterium]|nr:hypothetical protein [Anaerolineales bacterium]
MPDPGLMSILGRGILTAPPAYLDPGSGSFLLQLLLAGILGGLFVLRTQWAKVKGFFQRIFTRGGRKPDEHDQ